MQLGVNKLVSDVGKGISAFGTSIVSGRGDAEKNKTAHSASAVTGLTPPTLIEVIGSLAMHFGSSSIIEGLKAIPSYVGTAAGLVETAARKIGGTIEDAQRACVTIRDHAVKGEPDALRVIQLLGVSEEVALAQRGEKTMIIRL